MDEDTLNELLECSVCLDRLDSSSKVLPCQHTFCRRCLDEIVSSKRELRCPECRMLVTIKVGDLPANILLIRLLEGLKTVTSTPLGGKSELPRLVPLQGSSSVYPCAKALYNYDAKEPGDLSFRKGEVILLHKQVDENWYYGQLKGGRGFFPATYVQVIQGLPQKDSPPQCTAKYDFVISDENEKDCLSFKKDDVLTVIRRVDENWAEGKLRNRIGIFPISFVETNEAARVLLSLVPCAKTSHETVGRTVPTTSSGELAGRTVPAMGSSGLRNGLAVGIDSGNAGPSTVPVVTSVSSQNKQHKRYSLSLLQPQRPSPTNRHSVEIFSPTSSEQTAITSASAGPSSLAASLGLSLCATTTTNSCSRTMTSSVVAPSIQVQTCMTSMTGNNGLVRVGNSLPTIYQALYTYKPQKADELDLHRGDYYTVTEKCLDGWYKGACLRSGVRGVFPGNYVQQVRFSHPTKCSLPARAKSLQTDNGAPTPTSSATTPSCRNSIGRTQSFPKTTPHVVTAKTHPGEHSKKMVKNSCTVTGISAVCVNHDIARAASPVMCHNAGAPTQSRTPVDQTEASPLYLSTPSTSVLASSPKVPKRHHRRVRAHAEQVQVEIKPRAPSPSAGAVGGEGPTDVADETAETAEERTIKIKKDRDKVSLMKRLASAGLPLRGRKSKSPPATTRTTPHPTHQRSGSDSSLFENSTSCLPTRFRSSESNRPSKGKALAKERYRCIVPYPPQSEQELELLQDDVIYVHKKRDDGWFNGTLVRTGKTGLFPGSFVEKVKDS